MDHGLNVTLLIICCYPSRDLSQLLYDGYVSNGNDLKKLAHLDQYGSIQPSDQLFQALYGIYIKDRHKNSDTEPKIMDASEEGLTKLIKTSDITDVKLENSENEMAMTIITSPDHGSRLVTSDYQDNIKVGDLTSDSFSSSSGKVKRQRAVKIIEEKEIYSNASIPVEESVDMLHSKGQNEKTTFSGEVNQHELRHLVQKNNKALLCCYCNKEQKNLNKHILLNHGKLLANGILCNICGIVIHKKVYNFNMHLKTHSEAKHYLCPDCGLGFKRGEAMHRHYQAEHTSTVYQCEKCQKTFQSRGSLRAHIYGTHNAKENQECRICRKRFKFSRDLTNHLLIHTDAKPYDCPDCSKKFRTQSQLIRHKNQQHNIAKKYYCGLCGYSSVQKCNLKIHMKKHTGVKYADVHICSICDSVYPQPEMLSDHRCNSSNY